MTLSGNDLGDAMFAAVTAYFNGLTPGDGGVLPWDRSSLFDAVATAYGAYLNANTVCTITSPPGGAPLTALGTYAGTLTAPPGDIYTTLPAAIHGAAPALSGTYWRIIGNALVSRITGLTIGGTVAAGPIPPGTPPGPPPGPGGVFTATLSYDPTGLAAALMAAATDHGVGEFGATFLTHLTAHNNITSSTVPVGNSVGAAPGVAS